MNGYQDAGGNQLFGDDSGGDVLDFETPQASSSRSSFDQASQSSFDQMALTINEWTLFRGNFKVAQFTWSCRY